MKKLKIFALVLVTGLAVAMPFVSEAHDLIPRPLTEYIQQNPNATPEEIKAFADAQVPEYSEDYENGEQILTLVRNQDTTLLDNAWDFLKLGVEHILSGADHIIFVLSLLLVFASIRDIIKLTTIFTVGHSITLILSGTGLLTVSPSITEPIIALSIAYVAITTVFLSKNKFIGNKYSKPISVFIFSLFHGLGFAGLLKEIQIPADKFVSSLFSFNVGIEIGQLVIIAIAIPLIFAFRKQAWYPNFIKIFALIIAALALFWAIQRIFFGG